MGQAAERKSIRTNFVLLLHFCIIAFFVAGWFIFVFIMALSGERILHYTEDYFIVFIFPLVFGAFLSVISVALSNILRQKWWFAVLGTIFLLGTPLLAWVITWIGKQIARYFYLATPSDLEKTILVLNMSVQPRNEFIDQTAEPAPVVEKAPVEPKKITEPLKTPQKSIPVAPAPVKSAKPLYYGLWQTTIAALFGGVLAGGLMISLNYKNLKEKSNYITGLAISIVGQFFLITLNAGLAYSDTYMITKISILLAVAICVYLWQRELQNEDVEDAISTNKGQKRSWWGVVALVVLSWVFFGLFNGLAEEIIWSLDMPFR
jgi:hypothetical protein